MRRGWRLARRRAPGPTSAVVPGERCRQLCCTRELSAASTVFEYRQPSRHWPDVRNVPRMTCHLPPITARCSPSSPSQLRPTLHGPDVRDRPRGPHVDSLHAAGQMSAIVTVGGRLVGQMSGSRPGWPHAGLAALCLPYHRRAGAVHRWMMRSTPALAPGRAARARTFQCLPLPHFR